MDGAHTRYSPWKMLFTVSVHTMQLVAKNAIIRVHARAVLPK